MYNTLMKQFFKKTFIIVFCLMMLMPSAFKIQAEDDGTETIRSTFYITTTHKKNSYEIKFNRDWFKQDARIYSHDLAKISLAMATAAFRPAEAKQGEADVNLTDFLTQAHFKDLRSDDYDKDPNMYTISTVMGHQTIGEGEDSFELIAVGLCGQGYVDEWESNFSIGDGLMHDGFGRSSQLVYDRIFGYIAAEHIDGPKKIWISGFSRAAAVTNITAARLSDSNVFDQQSVFAYTFASPNTVIDENDDRYENIFNIVGKIDPVPAIPFADWGYGKYGREYYLPSLETDSDFEAKSRKANKVYKELTGIDYWYNLETNATIRIVLNYMLELCPDRQTYKEHLQSKIIRLYESHDIVSVLSNLLEIANDPELINDNNRESANGLLNYLLLLLSDYGNKSSMFRHWNSQATLKANFVQAHTPELYVSWIMSSDSAEELFSDSLHYSAFYIDSPALVELIKDGEVIEKLEPFYRVDENGNEIILIPEKERITPEENVYISYAEKQIVVLVPRDHEYIISLNIPDDSANFFYELDYSFGRKFSTQTTIYGSYLKKSDCLWIFCYPDGKTVWDTNYEYADDEHFTQAVEADASQQLYFTRVSFLDIYWRNAVVAVLAIIFSIIAVLVLQLSYTIGKLRFKRSVKKGWLSADIKYKPYPFMCVIGMFLLFNIMEFSRVLFPDNKLMVVLFKTCISILSILIAYMGYKNRNNNLSRFILIAVICLGVADIVMSFSTLFGGLLHIIAYSVLTYAFIKEDKPELNQIIIFAVASIIAVIFILNIEGQYGLMRFIAIIYVCTAILMVTTSFTMPKRIFIGSVLLFISGILLIRNEVQGITFLSHMISLGIYYCAIATLASAGNRIKLPKLVPEEMVEYDSN